MTKLLSERILESANKHQYDFITGEKFINLGHIRSAPDYGVIPNYIHLNGSKIIITNQLLYCHIHLLEGFLTNLEFDPNASTKLITHNEDWPATLDKLNTLPTNIRKWFSTNVESTHERMRGIPIGLPNSYWKPHGQLGLIKEYMQDTREQENLLFVCINTNTNPEKRYECINAVSNWSHIYHRLDYHHYIRAMHNHKFVASPRGNGIDCHRTWEALYLGCIPIVERSNAMSYFSELPILFIDSWNEVTPSFLAQKWEEMQNSVYNLDMLWMQYWREEINNS